MQLVNIFRKPSLKAFLAMLLIAVFTLKACDMFVDYYSAYNKPAVVQNEDPAGDESPDLGEDCFEKSAKKVYSCFDYTTSFRLFTWSAPLSIHWDVYSFSIFKEPLRVVLTPPPNLLQA